MDTWVYNHPAVAGTVSIFNRYIGKFHDWIALQEIQGDGGTKGRDALNPDSLHIAVQFLIFFSNSLPPFHVGRQ